MGKKNLSKNILIGFISFKLNYKKWPGSKIKRYETKLKDACFRQWLACMAAWPIARCGEMAGCDGESQKHLMHVTKLSH